MKNILLIAGGGGDEHEISLTSCAFIRSFLVNSSKYRPIQITIEKDKTWKHESGVACELNIEGQLLIFKDEERRGIDSIVNIDYVIPYMHGYPAETGHIQGMFSLMNLPYFGSNHETHSNCFNKITTKLWLEKLEIPVTPYVFLTDLEQYSKAEEFYTIYSQNGVFVKASSQGSSVGCYPVSNINDLKEACRKAFQFSESIIIEEKVKTRELEVSAFVFQNEIKISLPGEIITSDRFYSYEEKYSQESKTTTETIAKNLSPQIIEKIQDYAFKAFKFLKIKDLSRIDFFLTSDGRLFLNEINTLPGMTPISMFPKMLEATGISFEKYLIDRLDQNFTK